MRETTIKEIIELNIDLVEHKNGDIIILHSDLRDKVFDYIDSISDEEIDTKELIKIAIREAFELKINDIIVVKKEQIFIKIFEDAKRKQISSSEKNTIAGRFNGIEEEELKSFYDEYFFKEGIIQFFRKVVKIFVEKRFNEEQIDNLTYENNVFKYIQFTIMEQLKEDFDCSDDFSKGFSGYIFRIHFNDVFEYISDFMLNEISASNDYLIDFLKYYSLDIVIVNGIKYKVPELEADSGLRWNVISMLSIAKIYTRSSSSIKKMKKKIELTEKKVSEFCINNLPPIEYNKIIYEEKKKLSKTLDKEKQKLIFNEDSMRIEKEEKKKLALVGEINKIKKEINQLKRNIERLDKKEIKKSIVDKYQKVEREMETQQRELKALQKILIQNEKGYLSIRKSLAKALISKKKRI